MDVQTEKMPPRMIPEYKKPHRMGMDEITKNLDELKQEVILEITKINPIVARGNHDHLVKVDKTPDSYSVTWNEDVLNAMMLGDLIQIKGFLEKIYESKTRKY